MADIMDCMCDTVVGSSFIANVNLLASQFGTLQNILNVPDEVKNSIAQIETIKLTIDNLYRDILELKKAADQSVIKAETQAVNASNIRQDTANIHVKVLEVLDKCRRYLDKVKTEVLAFEGDKIIAEGISNGESVFTAPADVCPGSLLTIKGFRYPVGRNTLLVSCDGVEFYRWIHFEEVGPKGSVSSIVKFNVPINKGSVLKFYNISSSMAESAYVKAKELKCELTQMQQKLNKDLEIITNAKNIVQDGVAQVNMLRNQVKDYIDRYLGCCNGVLVLSDINDIPNQDCLFIVNALAPRKPVLNPCNKPCVSQKRPLFSEGSICGTIAQKRMEKLDYQTGCFDVTYNSGRC